MARSIRQKIFYALPAAVLIVAGLSSLGAQKFVFPAEAEPAEWKPAADYVLERIEEDDLVRTHPPWNLDALPHLESVGDQIDRRRDPILEDIYGAERVWVLAETPRTEEAIERLPFDPDDPAVERFGDVSVIRAPLPESADFSWEALQQLSGARVERVEPTDDGTSVRECSEWSASDRRWDCGSRDQWLYVGETYRYLGGDARHAIWAHPLPGKKRLRITFPDVPLEETLRIRAGYTFKSSRKDRGKPVTMEVRLDGETLDRQTYPILETTWNPLEFDTSDRAGETGELTVVIQTTNIRDRYFCFNAWVQ